MRGCLSARLARGWRSAPRAAHGDGGFPGSGRVRNDTSWQLQVARFGAGAGRRCRRCRATRSAASFPPRCFAHLLPDPCQRRRRRSRAMNDATRRTDQGSPADTAQRSPIGAASSSRWRASPTRTYQKAPPVRDRRPLAVHHMPTNRAQTLRNTGFQLHLQRYPVVAPRPICGGDATDELDVPAGMHGRPGFLVDVQRQ